MYLVDVNKLVLKALIELKYLSKFSLALPRSLAVYMRNLFLYASEHLPDGN